MAPNELDPQEADVPQMALQALQAAQDRAIASGRPVILVVNRELVEISSQGRVVLKKLPPRPRVSVRVKRATS